MAAKSELKLSWWPLARDSACYAICLAFLIGFFFDKRIENWEAAVLFFLYILYVCMMSCNRDLERIVLNLLGNAEPTAEVAMEKSDDIEKADKKKDDVAEKKNDMDCGSHVELKQFESRTSRTTSAAPMFTPSVRESTAPMFAPTVPDEKKASAQDHPIPPRFHFGLHELFSSRMHLDKRVQPKPVTPRLRWKVISRWVIRLVRGRKITHDCQSKKPSMSDVVLMAMANPQAVADGVEVPLLSRKRSFKGEDDEASEIEDESDDDDGPMDLAWPSTISKRVAYVMLAPLSYTLYYTVPDVRREGSEKLYAVTFFMSVGWIAFFSYLMVW
jgi:hypothetical protein